MKFTIPRLDLLNIISKIPSIIPTNPALPVLVNVLLEVSNNELVLIATDLTISMRACAEVAEEKNGSITLPARKFFQLIRELTAPSVLIDTLNSEAAYITSGSSHFKLSGMPKTEFHSFPDCADSKALTIASGVLKEALTRSAFAAARDDNRQVLNGVLLDKKGNTLTFVGTDGKKLARIFVDIDSGEEEGCSCLIPLKAVEEIIKILDTKEGPAKIFFLPNKIGIQTGNVTLITKLLNGKYPNIDNFIPEKSKEPINLHREELMSLLRQVSLFTTEENLAVHFTFKNGELLVTTASGSVGEGNGSMAVNYKEESLNAAFHPNFFLDILRHSKDETIQLSITDSYNPTLLTDSTNAQFVLVPMRIENRN
jgi:DNA polymerase III subunit beta